MYLLKPSGRGSASLTEIIHDERRNNDHHHVTIFALKQKRSHHHLFIIIVLVMMQQQSMHLLPFQSLHDAPHRKGRRSWRYNSNCSNNKTTTTLRLLMGCISFLLLASLHVANGQDPLYQPQQQQHGRRRRRFFGSGRSIYDASPISNNNQRTYDRNVYQPDWSTRILTEDEWRADPRARLYQVNPLARRTSNNNNKVSWTNRLFWINIVAFMAQVAFPSVTNWGVKISSKILRGEQLYRLVTPMFLHGGIAHLFTNMYSLRNVGPDLERLIGSERLVLTYLMSGVAGNVLSAYCSPNPSLGASGAIFGMVSAYYIFFLRNEWMLGRWGLQMQQAITQTIALNLILGAINPMVDQWGHVGGAIGGAAVAHFLGPRLYMSQYEHYNCIVDRPPIRIPQWIESIPQRLSQPWIQLTQRLSTLPIMSSMKSMPFFANDKPWRQFENRQLQRNRQQAPNRSIKPRW
jgi:membrane associated rhomboid family serine protease